MPIQKQFPLIRQEKMKAVRTHLQNTSDSTIDVQHASTSLVFFDIFDLKSDNMILNVVAAQLVKQTRCRTWWRTLQLQLGDLSSFEEQPRNLAPVKIPNSRPRVGPQQSTWSETVGSKMGGNV